ncbi:hypothetical protein FGO68_gene15050 [Halteria grandinella]|uniref:Uncharacterized protein n=1 Tax=Halteria grandinella TaxID=5974 RepID=A0A8J8NTY4_HALGN|nr:hypothetical protein FGO68_gene15050 [Halteria grandinella]
MEIVSECHILDDVLIPTNTKIIQLRREGSHHQPLLKSIFLRIRNKYIVIEILAYAFYQNQFFYFLHRASLSINIFLIQQYRLIKAMVIACKNAFQITDPRHIILKNESHPMFRDNLIIQNFTYTQLLKLQRIMPHIRIEHLEYDENFGEFVHDKQNNIELDIREVKCYNLEQIVFLQKILAQSSFQKLKLYCTYLQDPHKHLPFASSQDLTIIPIEFQHVTLNYAKLEGLKEQIRYIRPTKKGTLVIEVHSPTLELEELWGLILECDMELLRFRLVLYSCPRFSLNEYCIMSFAVKHTIQFKRLDHQIFETEEGQPLEESEMETQQSLIKQSVNIQDCVVDINLANFLQYQDQIAVLNIRKIIIRIDEGWFPDLESSEIVTFNDQFAGDIKIICSESSGEKCKYMASLAQIILTQFPNTSGLMIDEGVEAIDQYKVADCLNLKSRIQKLQIIIMNLKNLNFYNKLIETSKQTIKSLDIILKQNIHGQGDPMLAKLENSLVLEAIRLKSDQYFLSDIDLKIFRTFKNLRVLILDGYTDDRETQLLFEEELQNSLANLEALEVNVALMDPVKAFQGPHRALKRLRYYARRKKPRDFIQEVVPREVDEIVAGKRDGFKFESKFTDPFKVYPNAILIQIK